MPLLVKLNTGQKLILCDYHHLHLGIPSKVYGTTPDGTCEYCIRHSIFVITYTLDVNHGCKVFCDNGIKLFLEANSAQLLKKRETKNPNYTCAH